MRIRRLKISGASAVYHCISRTVAGAFMFDAVAKERLRRQLWQVADFSGVEVLTYCLMSNHFHLLIRVPDREEVVLSDRELLRRYAVLYPEPTPYQTMTVKYLAAVLQRGGEEAQMWRRRLLVRMHDVSEFMKTLKQRYTIWYNQTHERYGTLWAERFKSTIVEGREAALRVTAAYIDLNPVRAGIVEDPKDYRWSGYGAAMERQWEAGLKRGKESLKQSAPRMVDFLNGGRHRGSIGSCSTAQGRWMHPRNRSWGGYGRKHGSK